MYDVNRATWNLRLGLIGLTAVSVSLPMAWISLAKVLIFVCALLVLVNQIRARRSDSALGQMWTPWAIAMLLVCSAGSGLWTAADLPVALVTFVKHSKLLEIVLLISLIRTATEARVAVTAFAFGQAFMLLSSWLMVLGVNIPWHAHAPTPYVVFSTYLDQSIMFATSASVFWHLRHEKLWSPWVGGLGAALAIASTLLVLEGRSGYLVALAALALAIMWAVPRRFRLATFVVAPVVILMVVALGSTQVQERIGKIVTESQNFARTQKVEAGDSSGWRLNAWYRSVQAIADKPLQGHGVGAWTFAVKRMEGKPEAGTFGEGNQSNPHQEFLLWGVELGIGGLLLFLACLVCVARDALQFQRPVKRATLAVLVAIFIACLFNWALYDDLLGDFLVVTLGLLMALGVRTASGNESKTVGVA
nr:O-antigen ligase family protein [Rhodoferax sp.]